MKPKPKAVAKPPRSRNRFKKTETKRLISAVLGAGLPVARIEQNIETGIVTVFPGAPEKPTDDTNPWLANETHEKQSA